MNQIKTSIGDNSKKHPGQLSINFNKSEVDEISIIVYCGYEGIDEIIYASSDESDVKDKITLLKAEAMEVKLESDKYTEDEIDLLLESEKPEDREKYRRLFASNNEPDRFCVMRYNGTKFSCACKEMGATPSQSWFH